MNSFTNVYENVNSTVSAFKAIAVTPSDSTEIRNTRALYIGTGGDVVVTMATGGDATFKNVPEGTILPVQVIKVKSATTASDIVALY